MFASSTAVGHDWTPGYREPRRLTRRPVRVALVTWPGVVFLGVTVVASACLFADCDKRSGAKARETRVGHAGTVRSIGFSSGGAFTSVGIDGSIVIWGRTGCIDHPFLPDGPGQVRSAAFSALNRVVATANLNEPVTLHNLVGRSSRSLLDRTETTTAAACLAFAPDGAMLAVGQQDGQISLWDTGSLCKLSSLRRPR